jgi:macrolide transport system ATP-binding/permease protein
LNRKRREADLREELRFHLETEAEERREAGADEAEARRGARLDFGNLAGIAEETRAAWGWTRGEQLAQDIRYAVRTLAKSRAFSATAVLCLALGIGANTLLYSLTDAILFRRLAVSDPTSLVRMTWRAPKVENHGASRHDSAVRGSAGYTGSVFSYAAFELFARHDDVFSSVLAYQSTGPISLTIHDQTTPARGEYVSGDYFGSLGIVPAAGRLLTADDDREGAPAVVVITAAVAEARFGGADAAIGRRLLLNNAPFTIVGVAPGAFFGTDPGLTPDLYVPLRATFVVERSATTDALLPRFTDPGEGWLEIMGRLEPGMSLERAQATLAPPFQRFTERVKDTGGRWEQAPSLALVRGAQGIDGLRRGYATPLLLLMGLAGLILLLACSNIANLLLARSAARTREIAVRLSLGAARARVIRQLLTESVVLSCTGGLAGVGLAMIGGPAVAALVANGRQNSTIPAELDWHALAFACGLSLLTGLVFGVVPAIRATRAIALPAIRNARATPTSSSTGRRAGPMQSLVALQLGATLVLLVAAGLFTRTLASYAALDLGFDPNRVLTVMVNARQAGFDDAGATAIYRDLRGRFAAMPGVVSVGMSDSALMGDGRSSTTVVPAGQKAEGSSFILKVGGGFFRTMAIPIVRGREIDESDERAGAKPVVVVNEAYARARFGGEAALGQRVRIPNDSARIAALDFEVVGIARDIRHGRLLVEHQPIVFVPFSLAIFGGVRQMVFEIRTSADPSSHEKAVRQIVHDASPRMPITRVATQASLIDRLIAAPILLTRLCVTFAILALTIAVVGLYGSVAYDVSRRVPEIGVRMALGASQGDVVRMVFGRVIGLAAAGVALGVPGALFASAFAETYLFGVTTRDPLTIAAASVVLLLAAFIASYAPARAAARLNPTLALRRE